jgi:anti-sigma B factor antagonist
MAYSIRTESSPVGPVIAVGGEADAGASPALDDALREVLLKALAEGGAETRTIIVDLSETLLVDSRTIGVLAKWIEQLRSRGWQMPIVCAEPNLLRLFRLIGLEDVFDFRATRQEAIDATGGGS